MIRCLALAIALVGIAAGCGDQSPSTDQPQTKVFELALYYPSERDGYVGTGSAIREIDPDTLKPRTRRGLRLGGYVERLVFSPGRTEAAFGIDFGELVLVDLRKMELKARLRLGSPDWLVRPIGWPRPDLLYALGCNYLGKYGCFDNRLLLIDPTVPRQLASFDLAGGADGRYDHATRKSVIFVAPRRVAPARLLIAEPTGAIHEVELARILVGKEERRFGPHSRAGEFVLDRGRAIVFGTRGLIAEVSLRSRVVRYHRVPDLAVNRVNLRHAPSEPWAGTVSPMSDESVFAARAWPAQFLITPGRSRLGNQGERVTVRRSSHTWLLDTETWRTQPWLSGYARRAADVLIVSKGARPYGGPRTLLAYERPGAIRYRLRFRGPVTYSTYGNRLYVGRIDGRTTRIFDARTGRLLHRIPPTEVNPAFSWTPPE